MIISIIAWSAKVLAGSYLYSDLLNLEVSLPIADGLMPILPCRVS